MVSLGLRDVIGPVMVGPSSSHTAGALRIAYMARRLAAARPVRVEFRLLGSFAHTLVGHGTDKALVAGMLGFAPDDLRIRDSFAYAEGADLSFTFTPLPDDDGFEHPNTIDVILDDEDGGHMEVRGESIGGGAAVIKRIDGVDVFITGDIPSVVVPPNLQTIKAMNPLPVRVRELARLYQKACEQRVSRAGIRANGEKPLSISMSHKRSTSVNKNNRQPHMDDGYNEVRCSRERVTCSSAKCCPCYRQRLR